MKRIILFALCLLLGILALTGCSGNSEPFYEKDYTADGGEIKEIHIDVRDRRIEKRYIACYCGRSDGNIFIGR